MSVGPPALSNILVQRLDAVLGTSMSAYANLLNGARPDAVPPPGEAGKNAELDENGQPIATDGEGGAPQQIADAKTATALSLAARGLVTSTDLTPSAPTTLGVTARTILALLAQSPENAPPSLGKAPLWSAASSNDDETQVSSGAQAGQAAGVPTLSGQQAAQQAGSASQQTGQQGAQEQQPQAAANPTSSAGQQQPAASTATGQAASVQATATAGGPQAPQLTQALRAALQQTGLFYESHLTQMVFGQRTATQLASEPQARLDQNAVITRDTPMQPNAQASAQPGAQANAQATPAPAQNTGNNNASPAASQNTSASARNLPSANASTSSTSLSLSSSLAASGNPLAGIHPDATALVHQQLDVLANQSLVWQGQAWPGTHMEWEVARDRTQGGELMDDTHWATRLQIELPRLGLVQARLNLSGNQVVMSLVAPSSASELSQNSNALRQQFVSAGLALSQLTVDTQPPSPFDLS